MLKPAYIIYPQGLKRFLGTFNKLNHVYDLGEYRRFHPETDNGKSWDESTTIYYEIIEMLDTGEELLCWIEPVNKGK